MRRPKRSPMTARNKMMDLIAGRDHSEMELRQKLKPHFTTEQIATAIDFGKTQGWIPDTEEGQTQLAKKSAAALHRKNKGIEYINQQLSGKGLPPIESDSRLELEKALTLVKNKYSVKDDINDEEKEKLEAKMGRFLISRGFEMETIDQIVRKVIYEKF